MLQVRFHHVLSPLPGMVVPHDYGLWLEISCRLRRFSKPTAARNDFGHIEKWCENAYAGSRPETRDQRLYNTGSSANGNFNREHDS